MVETRYAAMRLWDCYLVYSLPS